MAQRRVVDADGLPAVEPVRPSPPFPPRQRPQHSAAAAWPIMSPPGALPLRATTYQLTATMAATALPAPSHTAARRLRCVRASSKPSSAVSAAAPEASLVTTVEGPVTCSASPSMGSEANQWDEWLEASYSNDSYLAGAPTTSSRLLGSSRRQRGAPRTPTSRAPRPSDSPRRVFRVETRPGCWACRTGASSS